MAASRLAKPGTEYGPCAEECKHRDCAQTRTMAAAICHHCQKAVGYDVRFYDISVPPMLNGTELVHALCEEEAAEKDRQ